MKTAILFSVSVLIKPTLITILSNLLLEKGAYGVTIFDTKIDSNAVAAIIKTIPEQLSDKDVKEVLKGKKLVPLSADRKLEIKCTCTQIS